ncbi:MAG: SAM-dependent methyltransferase, partial [Pseudomonadota bacterium]
LHRIRPQEIAEMIEIQRALAAKAAQWLKPGGTLVYAVCSLEREEGEDQAEWINAELGLQSDPIAVQELPAGLKPTVEGWVRTDPGMLPDQGGLDGFFVARWTKP